MGDPHTGSRNRRVVGGSRRGGTGGRRSRFAAGATAGGKAAVASGLAPTGLWPLWLTGRRRGTALFCGGSGRGWWGGEPACWRRSRCGRHRCVVGRPRRRWGHPMMGGCHRCRFCKLGRRVPTPGYATSALDRHCLPRCSGQRGLGSCGGSARGWWGGGRKIGAGSRAVGTDLSSAAPAIGETGGWGP